MAFPVKWFFQKPLHLGVYLLDSIIWIRLQKFFIFIKTFPGKFLFKFWKKFNELKTRDSFVNEIL